VNEHKDVFFYIMTSSLRIS